MSYKYIDAAALKGKTITEISKNVGDEIRFKTDDGKQYSMNHHQDCCESVSIHDIVGDLQSLVGSPLELADEQSSHEWPEDVETPDYLDSFTWTTYRFKAEKSELVLIRWLGESNGYYSESVQIDEIG